MPSLGVLLSIHNWPVSERRSVQTGVCFLCELYTRIQHLGRQKHIKYLMNSFYTDDISWIYMNFKYIKYVIRDIRKPAVVSMIYMGDSCEPDMLRDVDNMKLS